jgi:hypothetical protein
MSARALVRQGHSMLVLSRRVGAMIAAFFAAGRFE